MKRFVLPILVLAGGAAAFGLSPLPTRQGPQQAGQAPSKATYAPPGFEVQLVYHIPLQTQGSWVSLAVGPNGDLYASDQNAAGLYRIRVTGTLDTPDPVVTKVPLDVTGFQGMVWAFNSLYGNKNANGAESGIYRMRDTNNDGELDAVQQLPVGIVGGGEHGNHDVLLTEDGQGLYLINGNQSRIGSIDTTTVIRPWLEDEVTPHQPDARGHVRGLKLPGSTTIRINPDGTNKKLISMGYRNTYSAALNMQGELFGYDSDLEYDMGSPWYRPTRVGHITSGTDFGWRNGTGKLPPWTEGTMPPLVEIGPGSPTGVISGAGAKFPAKYQRAMYALDWTYSTVFAIHLTPKGASYTAEKEEFVFGDQFQVTDAAIGADGHMYVLTGGRGAQGDLWRVVYKGTESTAAAQPLDNPQAKAARDLRRSLEAFHGHVDPRAVAAAWPHLSSTDVYLRNAARAAIEAQPVAGWRQRALTERNPLARTVALLALARADVGTDRAAVVRSLLELDFARMNTEEKLAMLRTVGVVFLRLGQPTETERTQVIAKLQPLLPDADWRVNVELVRDLVFLRDAQVTAKAIALMQRAPSVTPDYYQPARMRRSARYGVNPLAIIEKPQSIEGLWYAWILRSHTEGWTPELARQFFTFVNAQGTLTGGASFAGHIADMKAEALRNMPAALRPGLASLTGRTFLDSPNFAVTRPVGPAREWTIQAAQQAVNPRLTNRSFEAGRNLFYAANCASCHRASEYGSDLGPDLTPGSLRSINANRVIEKLVKPDSIVQEHFKAIQFTLADGRTIVGLPKYSGSQVTIRPKDVSQAPVTVAVSQIRSQRKLDASAMPAGLGNGLNEEELADLVSFVMRGGDPRVAGPAPQGGGGGQPAPAPTPPTAAPRP